MERSLLILLSSFFLLTASAQSDDKKAETIASDVLEASGGRQQWEEQRYFHWNFFGARELWWDKKEHRVRIEIPKKELILIADLNEMSGKAWKKGEAVTDSSELKSLMQNARQIWINDSYWLFMPFKMLDDGVQLEHLETDTLDRGPAHKIRMTFDEVGVTPRNKYHVWVDKEQKLVRKWAYFSDREQEKPDMVTPWKEYRSYNGLLLSGDRGERSITDIRVPARFPEGTFDERAIPSKEKE